MRTFAKKLGLAFDPFLPEQAVENFFAGGSRQPLLDSLLEHTLTEPGLLLISGSLGSGKSTLAAQFYATCGEDILVARVDATLFMTTGEFFEALASQLPITATNPDDAIHGLQALASSMGLEARALVLVIDDAHEMSRDLLGSVSRLLQTEAGSCPRLLLFGESQLGNMLGNSLPDSLLQDLTEFELDGFSQQDCGDYIQFKLTEAGYEGPFPLADSQLQEVYAASRGIPGTINAVVTDALEQGRRQDDEAAGVAQSFSGSYWVFTGVLCLALLLVVLFYPEESGDTRGLESADGRISRPVATSPAVQPVETAGQENAPEVAVDTPAPATSPEDSVFLPEVEAQTAALAPVSEQESLATASEPELPVTASEAQQVVTQQPVPAAQDTGGPPTEPTDQEQELAQGPQADSPVADDAAAANPSSYSSLERRLLAYTPSSFTVQIMGSYSEQNIQRFIADSPNQDDMLYFETRFQQRPWFVLVLGNYATRAAASAAIDRLPARLRDGEPWIRSLADVQALIREHSEG